MPIFNTAKTSIVFLLVLLFQAVDAQTNISPSSVNGLALWLTGDSCKINSSSIIDTVYDLSANHNHAIQNNSSLQPISISSNLNGHKAILFDGVDDYLSFNAVNNIRTVFWVLKENNTPSTGLRPLLGHSNNYAFHRGLGGELYATGLADAAVTTGQTKLNKAPINGETFVIPNQYCIISLATTGNISSEYFSKDRANAARVWDGELLELIIYDQLLSTTDIAGIEDYLNNKYAPPINLPNDTSLTGLCNINVVPINPLNNQYGLTWSTGATTNSISINTSTKVWADAVNIFGIHSSDTMMVNLNRPNYFELSDSIFCKSNTVVWNTNLPKSDYTFQWQDGSTTDSVFTITQAGNYFVNITDSYGCSISTKTATVIEDNFADIVSLGNDTSICNGNTISLKYGLSATNLYTWNTGSTNDSLLITNSGQYSVIVTNTNNCIAKDTINIVVQGFAPTANFSSNIGCVNQIVSFTDLSIPPSGNSISNYEWDFGDTTSPTNTSTASNPLHTYTNTGTYTVNLTVTTNSNCAQSITKIINVYPVPTAAFAIGTSCQNDSTAFLNQSTGITGYSITNSYWNFGDASPSATTSITSPKHVFTNATIYTVKLLVTNTAGCKDSVYKPVNVNNQVKANFTNGPACLNNPTLFQSTSIIPPSGSTTYSWTFPGSAATLANPIKTFTNSGVYPVTLLVDGANGCTSTITKLVNIYLPPIASFSIPSFCAKDTVNVTNLSNPQSGIISSYNWRLNNTTFSTVQSPTLSITNPGNNSVRLTIINSFGCKDSTTNSLTIFPLPVVDFSTTPVAFYYINEPITFTPSITNANSYLWNMNGTATYSIQNPTETFNTEGSYNLSLNLKDQNGCKGSKAKNITVNKRQLDLAILNVSTTKDNDGFMTVVADLANYGSVPITSFKMGYQISDGGDIKETWNGIINPNSFYTFTFNAVSASSQNSENNITCVEIEKINTIIDDNTINNYFCSSLNTNGINVSNPLPNPTNGDIILPITLNRDLDYTIAIYNSVGQIQYEETTKKGIEGLNFVTLNTASYAHGSYIIKTMIDGNIFIKKFIKISYE